MNVSKRLVTILASLALALSAFALMPAAAGAQPRDCWELAYMRAMWLTQAQEQHIRWEETGDPYWLLVEGWALEAMDQVEVEMGNNHCYM